ncbi:cytochrome D ubiquinol oxidase subunit I [Flavobacterium sp. 316]|uniref:pyridoxal phosphate-dependent decarboxylase family protein n=1 Tax=Flavobacterium sp. 316 TaxID=1603293 RepID=UPI0005E2965E|nr:pyridoxal-dependent decarboxylase [Flavobacterium sp. 316]KIX20348.1 cytochrome D ubiquinol oxidase subunit I [Flavobacterium sp. 316]
MSNWHKSTQNDRLERITKALNENINFSKDVSLGYPASKLDGKVFYDDASFLKDAPVLMTYVANPNNIGCHTIGISEKAFKGTQEIEREVLEILAVDIFNATTDDYDGYIATGGTEANIEALWIYRNYFMNTYQAKLSEISILASEDTHYSIAKGANLLMIDWLRVEVNFEDRTIDEIKLETLLQEAISKGKKYFIIVANMGTTMFGSVDNPDIYTNLLAKYNQLFKLHIDAAYGGFVYPFLTPKNHLDFTNQHVSSITIDAHKMLQAPYGTGIFICRKNLIENVLTKEAAYVEGMDLTLSGSRSGANAVAVWMILKTYGKNGWFEKVKILELRTDWLCKQLDHLNITYFREPFMNIVTIKSEFISTDIASKFGLVPESHNNDNKWYKIVLMEHVEVDSLNEFISSLGTI